MLGFSILSIIYLAIFVRTILFTLIKSINVNKKFTKNSINNKACIFAVLFVMCFFIVNVMEFIQTNMGIQTGNIQENSARYGHECVRSRTLTLLDEANRK